MLRESQEKDYTLFENILNGFAYCRMLWDKDNRPVDFIYLAVNNSFEKLTGLRKKDILGKKATEIIPAIKDTHPELFDIYGKVALTGKKNKFDIYFKPLKKWLSISVYSPEKGYFIAVFDDITERKETEDELRAAEKESQRIINLVPGIIVTADANTRCFKKCNSAMTKILGFSNKEFLSRPFMEFLHPDDRQKTIDEIEKQFKGSSVAKFENRYICKDGSYKWLRWQATAADEQGTVYAIATDITEHKKAEYLILKQKKELESKNIALKEIVDMVTVEKEEINEKMIATLEKLIMPELHKLKSRVSRSNKKLIELIEKNLQDLSSSFGKRISSMEAGLSAREVEICDMIKNGLKNKKTAKILQISVRTVETTRKNIRRKLNLKNKNINLQTYLRTL